MQMSHAEIRTQGTFADALAALRSRRVFFAHQSVGANVLEGIARVGGGAPRLVESGAVEPLPPGTWQHARLGQNGAPRTKLHELCERVDAGLGRQVDVVLFKLCYLDVDARTDIAALHHEIAGVLTRLRGRFPRVRFVPMTVPLTAVQHGPRAFVKRVLGRTPGGVDENANRHALNERLRDDEPTLFDLARFEAEDARGHAVTARLGERRVPALAPSNTGDGGHLTVEARERIARHLVQFLAGLR